MLRRLFWSAALCACATALWLAPSRAQNAPIAVNLSGDWQQKSGTLALLDPTILTLRVKQTGKHVVATLLVGNGFIPAGKVDFKGDYTANPFPVQQVCASRGYVNPFWIPLRARVIDASHFSLEKTGKGLKGCAVGTRTTFERLKSAETRVQLQQQLASHGSVVLHDPELAFAKTSIQSASASILAQVDDLLKSQPNLCLRIEGYMDNVGDANYNLVLSKRRAESVFGYLIRQDIAADRLRSEGFGQRGPIAGNATASGSTQKPARHFRENLNSTLAEL